MKYYFLEYNLLNSLNISKYNQTKVTNKPNAPVVDKTIQRGVKLIKCTNAEIDQTDYLVDLCKNEKVDYIVLAGFLRKIPVDFIR